MTRFLVFLTLCACAAADSSWKPSEFESPPESTLDARPENASPRSRPPAPDLPPPTREPVRAPVTASDPAPPPLARYAPRAGPPSSTNAVSRILLGRSLPCFWPES